MAKKLMIVESPTKAKKIAGMLGADWHVAASFGHIRDLPEKEMGVAAPDFQPSYVFNEKGRSTVANLKKLAEGCDEVYLASDPDREGESIAWHLKTVLKLKDPKRVEFHEITETEVRNAIAHPRTINVKMVGSQEARRVLDRLVGYTVSPALSRQSGQNLSAGRVQSPAVRLVVDRERAIQQFKVTTHYGARIGFEEGWSAEWLTKPLLDNGDEYWMDKTFAEQVAGIRQVVVLSCKESESRSAPPAPFTTTTLIQAGSVKLSLSSDATMKAAQKLFEAGAITYMRTDSPNLAPEAIEAIRAYATANSMALPDKPRTWKAKGDAQEAHEAIRPTHVECIEAGDTPDEKALYTLIRNRAIASQLADALYDVRIARLDGGSIGGKKIEYEAKGRKLKKAGWLQLTNGDDTAEDKEVEAENPVPALIQGQALTAANGQLLEKKTKPLPRYTEASLIGALEAEGIGRPATYASIMKNIMNRGYIGIEKKKLFPSEIAFRIVDALVGSFRFIDLDFTRQMETGLDEIAEGKNSYKAVVTQLYDELMTEMGNLKIEATVHPCPECTKPMRRIKGGKGYFWGCTGYPECNVSLPDEGGKPGKKVEEKTVRNPQCTQALCAGMRRIKGSKGYFWGCTRYKEGCKVTVPDQRGKPQWTVNIELSTKLSK